MSTPPIDEEHHHRRGEEEEHLPVAETASDGSEREGMRWIARKGEVTLASSRHLPPAEIAQHAHERAWSEPDSNEMPNSTVPRERFCTCSACQEE